MIIEKKQEKILISVNDGLASRYVLRSRVLEGLLDSEFGVIIISPNADEPYFIEEFSRREVTLIKSIENTEPRRKHSSRLENFMIFFRRFSTPYPEKHIQTHFYRHFIEGSSLHPYQKIIFQSIRSALIRSRTLRKKMMEFEKIIANPHPYPYLYSQYQIATLLTCGMGYVYTREGYLLREASDHKIPIICAIPNWDHPTTKGFRSASADEYLVWSPAMREEWIRYQDTPPAKVHITGSAAFDLYSQPEHFMSKENFCKQYRLDSGKKTIVFATHSPTGFPYNGKIARILSEAIARDLREKNCQLLVRIHPNFFRKDASQGLDVFHQLTNEFAFVRLSIPTIYSEKLYGDMPMSENILVANLARHADVIVTVFSTMQLDGCICDTPVINVGFPMGTEGYPWFYPENQEHYVYLKRMIDLGSVRVARKEKELIQLLDFYLENPGADSIARKKAAIQELGPTEGNAAETIAKFVLARARKSKVDLNDL